MDVNNDGMVDVEDLTSFLFGKEEVRSQEVKINTLREPMSYRSN